MCQYMSLPKEWDFPLVVSKGKVATPGREVHCSGGLQDLVGGREVLEGVARWQVDLGVALWVKEVWNIKRLDSLFSQ